METKQTNEAPPRVFISYSWTTPEHEGRVLELAKRLASHEVHVVLDKWDLREGQDKYQFMEQAVIDPAITKVLLICDKRYQEKADSREGGVGDETMIISPQLYGRTTETKFIPVVFEKDAADKPYLPAYIASRIYIDLSDENQYEDEYEKLIRNIYGEPENKRPALGKKPEWISETKTDFAPLRDLQNQIRGAANNKRKEEILCRRFQDKFCTMLFQDFDLSGTTVTGALLDAKISEMKPMRDIYTDHLELMLGEDVSIADVVTSFFECLYNTTHCVSSTKTSFAANIVEHFDFFVWESFVCTVALLFHDERYKDIHDILCHTYFLKRDLCNQSAEEQSYLHFRQYFRTLENECNKPDANGNKLITYSGKLLLEREKKPHLTQEILCSTDVKLYHLSYLVKIPGFEEFWFPTSYVYQGYSSLWRKLKSRKYCQAILPLFGVKTIDALKELITDFSDPNSKKANYRYTSSFDAPQSFLYDIKLEEVGSLY